MKRNYNKIHKYLLEWDQKGTTEEGPYQKKINPLLDFVQVIFRQQ